MNRFFCLRSDITPHDIIISDRDQVHHIRDVLKLKPQEKVVIFDDAGDEYNCVIEQINDKICLKIKSKMLPKDGAIKMKLTVACAIPKKAKIDDIIDKLVQLGVQRFIPLKTERVVVKLDKHKEGLRLERWKKIALSAAKQSQRNSLLVIDRPKALDELLAESADFDLKLIPCLLGQRRSLKDILASAVGAVNIIILIGPEGDFSDAEVDSAVGAGFIPVSLGQGVLRVDTAAIACAAFIQLYAER